MKTYSRFVSSALGIFITLCLIVVLLPAEAELQEVANGQAVANVLIGLTVVSVQDLDFGDVYQGVGKTVGNDDLAASGIFTIQGEPGAGISVYLNLPEYLATATGDDRMDVTFGATDCSIDSTGNVDPSAFGDGWQNINPYDLPGNLTIGSAAPSLTAIFLGGRVTPSVDQTSGPYSADVIVTVAYTGS